MYKDILLVLLSVLILPNYVSGNQYPSSISPSDSVLAALLADIPLLSVGLVGFAAFTFFFVMRRINLVTVYIHLAVLFAFIAAIFDLSQIFHRGYWDTMYDLNISSVMVFIIFRDLGHSLSFGFRFLFFWAFVSEPPRGELPFVPVPDNRRPNFISLDSEEVLHSGNWGRYKLLGLLTKWLLLLLVIAVAVLQALWRLVNAFRMIGPVYITESGIEIGLSAVFIVKIIANTLMSPLRPRWHTFRDYSPVILSLLIGMGIAIGNLLCFKFSEATLGRFLQAIELYITILFVLISAFYKMPVRSSVVAELVRRRLTAAGFNDMESASGGNVRDSQLSMVQAPYQFPPVQQTLNVNSLRSNDTRRPSLTERISTSSLFNPRNLTRRQGSVQIRGLVSESNEEGDERRLWTQEEAEAGPSPAQRSFRTSIEQTPNQTPIDAAKEAPGWRDPVLTSIVREEMNSNPVPLSYSNDLESQRRIPQLVVPDDSDYEDIRRAISKTTARNETDSPVYGLDGIIRNLQFGDTSGRESFNSVSARSSGLESLMRQQQELDKSLAGLRRFSTNSRTISRMQSDSLQSEFSLSKFPDPPFFARTPPTNSLSSTSALNIVVEDDGPAPSAKGKAMSMAISDDSMIVEDVPFELIPPRMPAASEQLLRPQNQSIPSIARDSLDSVFGEAGIGRGVRLGSQGTQYDVTSFIGGLTTPGAQRSSPLAGISEKERLAESDSDSVNPATIGELTRVQIVDSRRLSEEQSVADSGFGDELSPPLRPPLPATLPSAPKLSPPEPVSQYSSQGMKPLMLVRGKGLPSGPRAKLEISNPIRRSSGVLRENAFERPRPAPLILRDPNDVRPTVPEPRKYF